MTLSVDDRRVMRAELVRDEGLRLKPYRCTAGKLTVGVGRNLDDVGISTVEADAMGITAAGCGSRGVTYEQAMALLDSDIARVERDLDRRLPWWRGLDPVRQRVLVNMGFNLGITRLLGFRNTLRFVELGDYAHAASNMLQSLWARQVGARAVRLADMMETGTC